MDEEPFETDGYRVLKGKVGKRVMKNVPHLGTGFIVNQKIFDSIIDFYSISSRLSVLRFKCVNKKYTMINFHAPINNDNKTNLEKVNTEWDLLDELTK